MWLVLAPGLLGLFGLKAPETSLIPGYDALYEQAASYLSSALGAKPEINTNFLGLIEKLNTETIDLIAKADAFDGGAGPVLRVQAASDRVAKAMKAAHAFLTKNPEGASLSVEQTRPLLPVMRQIGTNTQTALQNLVAKKALFERLGVGSIVLHSLKDQRKLGEQLSVAVGERLPSVFQKIFASHYTPIDKALEGAVAEFEGKEDL
jgi:hypothetical protein